MRASRASWPSCCDSPLFSAHFLTSLSAAWKASLLGTRSSTASVTRVPLSVLAVRSSTPRSIESCLMSRSSGTSLCDTSRGSS